jgi:hypothetical protein
LKRPTSVIASEAKQRAFGASPLVSLVSLSHFPTMLKHGENEQSGIHMQYGLLRHCAPRNDDCLAELPANAVISMGFLKNAETQEARARLDSIFRVCYNQYIDSETVLF